jgi:hypothetical protein
MKYLHCGTGRKQEVLGLTGYDTVIDPLADPMYWQVYDEKPEFWVQLRQARQTGSTDRSFLPREPLKTEIKITTEQPEEEIKPKKKSWFSKK